MDYLFLGMCIVLLIFILINQIKKVKPYEAYVIERHKRFYKVASSKVIFVIPFIDKIKCVINLNPQIRKCYPTTVVFADNKTTCVWCKCVFKVTDAQKVAYLEKKLENMIEYLAITELRSIVGKLDSSNAKYINDKVKEDLKLTLNKKACDLGCKIEDIQIKIENNNFTDNIENYNETSVVDYSMYNKSGFYIIIILCFIAYIFGYDSLQKAYVSTNNLLFYFFKVLLKSLPDFFVCFVLGELILKTLKNIKKYNKNLLGITIGIAIIFLCIYDMIDEPRRISISEDRTSNFSYKCAIISDIVSNQTTTVEVKGITTQKSYSKSTGGRKT